jgi:hypothetical protein
MTRKNERDQAGGGSTMQEHVPQKVDRQVIMESCSFRILHKFRRQDG